MRLTYTRSTASFSDGDIQVTCKAQNTSVFCALPLTHVRIPPVGGWWVTAIHTVVFDREQFGTTDVHIDVLFARRRSHRGAFVDSGAVGNHLKDDLARIAVGFSVVDAHIQFLFGRQHYRA